MFKQTVMFMMLATALCACTNKPAEADQPETPPKDLIVLNTTQINNLGIATGSIESTELSAEVLASGKVEVPPQQTVSVSMPIVGTIKTMALIEGMAVQKGQTLAQIQSMEYVQMQQEYLQALSQIAVLERELEREKDLAKNNAVTLQKLQQTEGELRNSTTIKKALEAKFELLGTNTNHLLKGDIESTLAIRSPISGVVKHINTNPGKYLLPSDILFELINLEHLHFTLSVFEQDAPKLKIGQKVILLSPVLGKTQATAKVFMISKAIDQDTKTLMIHAHPDNEAIEHQLIPGQFLSCKILVNNYLAETLPEAAVIMQGGASYVFVQEGLSKDGKTNFKKIAIKTGQRQNDKIEVLLPAELKTKLFVKKGAFQLNTVTLDMAEE
jgi:cobalt-zinc-cadmium efflux system membrane fusion protein